VDDLERRRRRLQSARFLIRAELAIAFAAPLVAGFLYVAAPGFMGQREPMLAQVLLTWGGIFGVIAGIVWMMRLSRPDPEAGERSWRYRDF
jgi:hypothetical protein